MSNSLAKNQIKSNPIIDKLDEIKGFLDKSLDARHPGLMGGLSGIALFYFYYSKHKNDQRIYDRGFGLVINSIDSINKGQKYHSYSNGAAGIGWLVEHLEYYDFIDSQTNDLLVELDEFSYRAMLLEIQNKNLDYLHGAIGIGLYYLNRLRKRPEVDKYISELVDEIEHSSELDVNGGLKWLTYISSDEKTKKCYNLSLSHGISSIIVFLSKVYELNVNKEKTLKLLNGAITYLINNQLDTSLYYSSFPNGIVESENPSNSRLAWCYGDLGIGMALYQAGKITGNSHWVDKAIEILLFTTKRRTDDVTSVVDAGLCHGTAGIAHIYNRMYGYTKNNTFKEAADYWFSKTLEMAKFDDGLAGYKARRNKETGGDINESGLLEGIAGIGLAILSYVSDIDPAWDECLLLS
mgnify:CR=1 FL=1